MSLEARAQLLRLLGGFIVTQALGVAARLGIADLVAARPRSPAELAAETRVDADALARVLRALASLGIFTVEDGVVRNTPLSELLRSDEPMSLRWLAQSFSAEHYRAWSEAGVAVREGRPVFERVFGREYFDWLGKHPDESETFNRAMAGGAGARRAVLLERDWAGARTVVDVGGGNGALLTALLARHTHLRGVVFDLPHLRAGAEHTIAAAGLVDRCSFEPGSFFERVPAGADVYVLSQVLHDWDDERATAILRRCRDAASPGTRLVVLELVLRGGDEADWGKLLDLHMLVMLGGRERSEDDWRELLRAGGFALETITPGTAGSLLQAAPLAAARIDGKSNPGAS